MASPFIARSATDLMSSRGAPTPSTMARWPGALRRAPATSRPLRDLLVSASTSTSPLPLRAPSWSPAATLALRVSKALRKALEALVLRGAGKQSVSWLYGAALTGACCGSLSTFGATSALPARSPALQIIGILHQVVTDGGAVFREPKTTSCESHALIAGHLEGAAHQMRSNDAFLAPWPPTACMKQYFKEEHGDQCGRDDMLHACSGYGSDHESKMH